VGVELPSQPRELEIAPGRSSARGTRVALLGYGTGVGKALEAAEILAESGISTTVARTRALPSR